MEIFAIDITVTDVNTTHRDIDCLKYSKQNSTYLHRHVVQDEQSISLIRIIERSLN